MSLGSFLASKENIETVAKLSWKFGRADILQKGMQYYEQNPHEVQLIKDNFLKVGINATDSDVNESCKDIVIHYFEKLFALVKQFEAVWICKNRVELGDSLEPFKEAAVDGKSVFVAQSHFGATYLLGSVLMVNGFNINMVGKFPEPIGSMLKKNSSLISSKFKTGSANLINLADKSVDVPMDMMKAFITKKIISNVFDENNEFSRPVNFMGTKVFGGSGMDALLKNFNDDRVILVTPFLVRTGEDSFRYEVDRHYFKDGDIIESFYKSLEKRVRKYQSQWYFIHELHESFEDKR